MADRDSVVSDVDLAFDLQMEEAITASLTLHSNTSPSPSSLQQFNSDSESDCDYEPYDYYDDYSDDVPGPGNDEEEALNDLVVSLMLLDIEKISQEQKDREQSEMEVMKIRDDLGRRIHDQKLASDILSIPEDEWEKYGDKFERPYGTDMAASSSSTTEAECFKLYFKGLVSEERIRDEKVNVAAIGAAVCDSRDNLLVEVKKPLEALEGTGEVLSSEVAELEALIEGLEAALSLSLKRMTFFCDDYMLYQYVTGRLRPRQAKVEALVNQVALRQREFTNCNPSLVTRNDIKFAFKSARDTIVSQITLPSKFGKGKLLEETCMICFEDTDVDQMFTIDKCLHRYCFSCMKQHVEVKLLNAMVAKCPNESCDSEVNIESCQKILAPKLIEVMTQRIRESSIPITEKVYCPYPRCSTLMSKTESLEYTKTVHVNAEQSGVRKCIKCHNLFCVNCKIPWHRSMSCYDYSTSNTNPHSEDAKLKSLATEKRWRPCASCNNMVELAEGCYHITCRCGYEFCYTCGAEWKNKKATCSCLIWDEHNIIRDE